VFDFKKIVGKHVPWREKKHARKRERERAASGKHHSLHILMCVCEREKDREIERKRGREKPCSEYVVVPANAVAESILTCLSFVFFLASLALLSLLQSLPPVLFAAAFHKTCTHLHVSADTVYNKVLPCMHVYACADAYTYM